MIRKEMNLGGRPLILETGLMAKQASGSVYVQYGETSLLVAVTAAKTQDAGRDFFPLQVEYREKAYAGGKIPGGFFKREGRPSDKEILASRLTDRPIRPLFPEDFMAETQVLITVLSADGENPADILGTLGASVALSISDIPWSGPVAAVRVGMIEGQYILNPTFQQLVASKLDVIVTGTATDVVMVEGESLEISEEELVGAIEFAQKSIKEVIDFQLELIKEINPTKRTVEVDPMKAEITKAVDAAIDEARLTVLNTTTDKHDRYTSRDDYEKEIQDQFTETYPEQAKLIHEIFSNRLKKNVRQHIVNDKVRIDGRGLTNIRPIDVQVNVLPSVHGSALFTRGETQALVVATLGTKLDEQILDNIEQPETTKSFMLHYNFPPYSVGETRPLRGTSRRETGHGNLAERSLKSFMPDKNEFPYTLRIVSEVLESNGSSSMATVCGGSLALMDAGVPIPRTVAGIAMGLIKEGDKIAVLSDILGDEDHYGDMDFKVAGTKDGITAIQMDLKIDGINQDVMRQALAQAKEGRLHIIGKMEAVLPASRENISQYAPRIITLKIPVSKIGDVIGPGGKTIKEICAATESKIDIDQDGTVFIYAPDTAHCEAAEKYVYNLVRSPEVGEEFEGKVVRIMQFGAFVNILPGRDGLVHISELAWGHVNRVEDVVNIGDTLKVKLMEIDDMGRMNLSHKVFLERPEGYVEPPPREKRDSGPRGRGGDRDRDRGGNRGGRRY